MFNNNFKLNFRQTHNLTFLRSELLCNKLIIRKFALKKLKILNLSHLTALYNIIIKVFYQKFFVLKTLRSVPDTKIRPFILISVLSVNFDCLTLRRPSRGKWRMRWFSDVSKVKETSFF